MGGAFSIKAAEYSALTINLFSALFPLHYFTTIKYSLMSHQEMNYISNLFGKLQIIKERKEVDEEMPEKTNEPICPTSPRRFLDAEGEYCGAKQLTICEDCTYAQKRLDQKKNLFIRVS